MLIAFPIQRLWISSTAFGLATELGEARIVLIHSRLMAQGPTEMRPVESIIGHLWGIIRMQRVQSIRIPLGGTFAASMLMKRYFAEQEQLEGDELTRRLRQLIKDLFKFRHQGYLSEAKTTELSAWMQRMEAYFDASFMV